MNKTGKPSFLKVSLLAALMTAALGTQAAGLGKLTVYSAIGQPLKAEVALTVTPEELASLSVKLASPDAFKEAGIDYMPALAGLQLSIVSPKKGQTTLKLATERPVNEPFLHFLVEMSWTAGRMVREYTFLLDPPEMLQVAKAASIVSPVAPAVTPLPVGQPTPEKSSSPAVQPRVTKPVSGKASSAAASGAEYQVVRGDTLSQIALENKPESVSLDQMLVALFNSNRDAFDGNNMNRLRAGKILRLPDAVEVAGVDVVAARKLIIGQAAEFNAYRRRLAEVAVAVPPADEVPKQQASGLIKPRVEEKTLPIAAKDKLEVSRTEAAKSAKTVGGSNLEEDLIARDKALREASERIVDLEKNIENLKHLVELKSQTGVQLQQDAQTTPAQAPQPAVAKPESAAASAPAVAEPAKPAEPAPAAAVEPPATPAASPAPVAAKPPVKKPVAPPPPEPDFIAENPQILYGGGALAAILLGYFGYAARRKKKALGEEELQGERAVVAARTAEIPSSTAVFGAASESVDNGEVSIQGDFSDVGMLTTEEKVDPVAEADVLMAYGRDRQAEEILVEGLRQDSSRAAIHMKLLELYAKQENIAEFETVANELHKLNNGRGADWERTQAMAQNLGLAGGLFLGTQSPAAVAQPQPVAEEALDTGTVAPEAEIQQAEDTGSLDFDLDLGTTDSGPAAAVAAEPVTAAPVPEQAMSLDFDFDLGSPESAVPQVQEEPEQAPATAVADEGSIDFDLDLGSDNNATAAAATENVDAVKSAEPDLAMGAVELDFDLDLGSAEGSEASDAIGANEVAEVDALAEPDEEVGGSAAAFAPSAAPAQENVAVEGPGELKLDFDLELDEEPAGTASAADVPAQLDLADISLDLDAVAPSEAPNQTDLPAVELAPGEVASADVDFAMDFDGVQAEPEAQVAPEKPVATTAEIAAVSLDDDLAGPVPLMESDNPEVATKLELAQAYEEMGDQEGARDLLNEVLNEGSAAQQAQARARLDQLNI